MEVAALIIAFGVLVVSGVAAAAAVVQAKAATTARVEAVQALGDARAARDESARLAAVATSAFVRQAEAQEKANALREAAERSPVWSGPRHRTGEVWAITNTSGRTVKVDRLEVEPEAAEQFVRWQEHNGGVYKYGESLDFMVQHRLSSVRPQTLRIFWRYDDEPDAELDEFIIPL